MTPTIPDAIQADKTLWCVNIKGPDDIISVPDHLSAVLMANTFNAWWLDLITKAPLTDNHPRMWAEPIEWPYSEGHGEDVTDPNNEYQWLRELTAALPFLTGVKVKALEWAGYGDGLKSSAFGISAFYGISGTPGNWTVTWPGEDRYIHTSGFKTQIEAKAAAQADYEARILSAIELPATEPSLRAQALEEAFKAGAEWCNVRRSVTVLRSVLDDAAKAFAALYQPVADGWLPIETAPKDGTQILIEIHPGIFDVVCWSDDAWREGGNFMGLRKAPTHWRPLPASTGSSE